MRPVFLEFWGINSFSEPAKIDFAKLSEFGIFGIFGDTGSGKSSILDCIGFALYGNIARSRSGSIADAINYAADRAYVHFEFEIVFEGRRRAFYVERELKRKNAAQSLKVYEKIEGSYVSVADGVCDGNAFLERVIGLEQKDFEKCIALPQGEFAQFVRAARGERLKLISRLFNLESYGENLVKRAGTKMTAAREALAVTRAKLERYAAISEQSNAALMQETERLCEEEKELLTQLSSLRAQEKTLSVRVEKRREQDRLSAEMQRLEVELPRMKAMNEELDRLSKADVVLRESAAKEQASLRVKTAEDKALRADKVRQQAQARLEEAQAWDAQEAEAEEQALSDRLVRAKSQAFREEECKIARQKLEQTEAQFAALRNQFVGFDYASEREEIEKQIASLGAEDFLAYVDENVKAQLLHAEYGVFADELTELSIQYPVIRPSADGLIEKYRALSQGNKVDLDAVRASFEERKKERKQLQDRLVALEKRKGRYDMYLQSLQDLTRTRQETAERIRTLSEGLEAFPPIAELEERLQQKRVERQKQIKQREEAQRALSEAEIALASAVEQLSAMRTVEQEAERRLSDAVADGGFTEIAQARELMEKYGDPVKARQRVEEYKERYSGVRARLRALSQEDLSDAVPERLVSLRNSLSEHEKRTSECTRLLAVKREELVRAQTALAEKKGLETDCSVQEKQYNVFERLRKLLEGNKFMEFVAEEYLQTVAANASGRLLSLTDGRYFLRYEGGFYVGDNFNGGNLRAVSTLSGGETFLVSLSLALSLSAEICARSLRPIEFFFLDEGFGTLDERLVDVVMDSLEKLKSENFSIGIISHVEELKHRIDRRLLVTKATERHGSQIRME